jgi:hypothetical protein
MQSCILLNVTAPSQELYMISSKLQSGIEDNVVQLSVILPSGTLLKVMALCLQLNVILSNRILGLASRLQIQL